MADNVMIHVEHLSKDYGGAKLAVDNISFDVSRGEVLGFLGPNGAGKTTTMKILTSFLAPSAGSAEVAGHDVYEHSLEARRHIGYLPEDTPLYKDMTVLEYLDFIGDMRGLPPEGRRARIKRVVEQCGIEDRLGMFIGELSKGFRQRVGLAQAILHEPEVLILDEPTSGLDPAMTEEVLQVLVKHVASEEMTVFFSSHQIAEVDQIADHVTVIDRGRAVVSGALDELRARYLRVQLVFDGDAPRATFRAPGIVRARREGRVLALLTSGGAEQVVAEARALNPISVDLSPVTLKEIFLESVAAED